MLNLIYNDTKEFILLLPIHYLRVFSLLSHNSNYSSKSSSNEMSLLSTKKEGQVSKENLPRSAEGKEDGRPESFLQVLFSDGT